MGGLVRRRAVVATAVMVAIGVAAIAGWLIAGSIRPDPELSIQPLTLDGRAGHATISADRRFIAYVRRDGGQSSVVASN